MASYSIAEAKNRLPALVREAESGEPVTITRHGSPVVQLVKAPVERKPDPEKLKQIYARLAELRASGPYLDTPSVDLIRAMRDEGV